MKFSIIIPLEYHRDQGPRCVEAWCRNQDFPPQDYEVLCVMPRTYPASERTAIETLLRPHDRLILSDNSHDMAHCVEGAAQSRGDILFFTESHVWPEPGVLKACAAVLERNPDWAAFSCKTDRVTSNLLGEVEAEMYERDIDYAMNVHPWRKILDQCFVTRRGEYLLSAGFDAALGHFAEWVLAAKYRADKSAIGYAPSVRLHHYYIGKMPELTAFTEDFIDGEISYFSRGARASTLDEPSPAESELLKPPVEWVTRGNWDVGRSRLLVKSLGRYCLRERRQSRGPAVTTVLRQLVTHLPAASGCKTCMRFAAVASRLWSRSMLAVARLLRSRIGIAHWFTAYQVALTHDRRLHRILAAQGAQAALDIAYLDFAEPNAADTITGFHAIESFGGTRFRWSGPAAIAAIKVPQGKIRLRLRCLKVPLRLRKRLLFYFDGRPVPCDRVVFRKEEVELSVKSSGSGVSQLLWICEPIVERRDNRRRGLPVISLSAEQRLAAN